MVTLLTVRASRAEATVAATKAIVNDEPFAKKLTFFSSPGASWCLDQNHRHLSNIDCLTARVFFIRTVNSRSKKRRKEAYYELR
jgi:hypothetical protein